MLDTCKKYLKYVFTEDEKKSMGNDLAEKFSRHDEAEARLKSVSTQIKSEIATIDAQMSSIAEKMRSGYEYRDVECWIECLYDSGVIQIVRKDTGEVVEERPMTAEERQQKLPLGGEKS